MTNIAALRCPPAIGKALLAMVLAVAFALTTVSPSRADQAARTRNLILGAAAAVAGIVIYNNYEHKKAAANTVVGYTRDGGTVYADGRIVYPNGTTYYTSNNAGNACGYGAYGGAQCGQYAPTYNGQYGNYYGGNGDNGDYDQDGD